MSEKKWKPKVGGRAWERQRVFLDHVSLGADKQTAAHKAGVSKDAVRKWLLHADFKEEYRRAQLKRVRPIHKTELDFEMDAIELVSAYGAGGPEGFEDGPTRFARIIVQYDRDPSKIWDLVQKVCMIACITLHEMADARGITFQQNLDEFTRLARAFHEDDAA